MKASAIAYGGILLILIISSLTIVYIIGGQEPVNRNVVSVEGKLMSFADEADLISKTFNQSIEFISQRAAYDLGKVGGIEGSETALWDSTYPSIDSLKQQLENRIKENLPQGIITNGRTIIWGEGKIDISSYDTKYFLINGNKSFSIYDKSIDSRISFNPYNFYQNINSNYFKLLNAGRAIMEDPRFNTKFKNLGDLLNELNAARDAGDPRFTNLNFGITVSGDIVEITIIDKTCLLNNDYYCIAPLKSGESGIINPLDGIKIPYDYLKLKFRISVENPIAPPACIRINPTVSISPSSMPGSVGSTLTYSVNVKNNDNSACESSIFSLSTSSCPTGWTCTLSKSAILISPGSTDYSVTISVTSPAGASPNTYTFKVKAQNSEESIYWDEDSGDYIIPFCTGTLSASITGSGTCTVTAGLSGSNCDGQAWQIRDDGNVKCSGTVSGSSYSSTCSSWTVSSGSSGTTYTYNLYIGGNLKDTKSVTCSPSIKCFSKDDCPDDSNPCTGKECKDAGTPSATCDYPALAAGTICGTENKNCPDKCESSKEYRNGAIKTCSRACDGVGNCQDCTPSDCTDSDYNTIKDCSYDCKNSTHCYAGIYCEKATAICDVCFGSLSGPSCWNCEANYPAPPAPQEACCGAIGNTGCSCTGGDQCFQEGTVPDILCDVKCDCTFIVHLYDQWSKVVTNCNACNFPNREDNCGPENNGCEPAYDSGCQLSSCYQKRSCTYNILDPSSYSFDYSVPGGGVTDPTNTFDGSLQDTSTYALITAANPGDFAWLQLNFSGVNSGSVIVYTWYTNSIPSGPEKFELFDFSSNSFVVIDTYTGGMTLTESYAIPSNFISSGKLIARFRAEPVSNPSILRVYDVYVA